ncbi:MAG TPA: ABC transporter ATP-binding protein [Nitriliruptoraceae bacterium]|nr:ABC transporter ATP-binding protein [Nitriliruptoraceae bacterium]
MPDEAGRQPQDATSRTGTAALAVQMTGISKAFGPVQALDDVDFRVAPGEVHGLLGENGAGKTTLMNVLTGLYLADAGSVSLHGEAVELRQPADAVSQGVGMVHQHFELVQAFTALENILLGAETATWSMNTAAHRARITELATQYGFNVRLDHAVAAMEIGDQQKVEILRILYAGSNILVLDEPTTHLTPTEVDQLFSSVRELAAEGLAVVLIAHKLHEVFAVCDRITVLRHGRLAGSLDVAAADRGEVVAMMMGEDVAVPEVRPKACEISDEVVLSLDGAGGRGGPTDVVLVDLDLRVHRGEFVGIAGVAGNGQRELMELLAGLRSIQQGRMHAGGQDVTAARVDERIMAGVAVLPGDRMREGVLPASPLYETYALGRHLLQDGFAPALLEEQAREMITHFDVRTSGPTAPTASLSGGNIQKVLVARALAVSDHADGGAMVVMNPTSGLDVGAAAFVHTQLVATCEAGGGVLLISEDLDELLMLCDRIVVLAHGRFVGEQVADGYDRLALGDMMVAAND